MKPGTEVLRKWQGFASSGCQPCQIPPRPGLFRSGVGSGIGAPVALMAGAEKLARVDRRFDAT